MRMHTYHGSQLHVGGSQFAAQLVEGSQIDFDRIVGYQMDAEGKSVPVTAEDAIGKYKSLFTSDAAPVSDTESPATIAPVAPARSRRGAQPDETTKPSGDVNAEKE